MSSILFRNSEDKYIPTTTLPVIPTTSPFFAFGGTWYTLLRQAFFLKHSQFKKFRDNQKYTEMINPLHDGVVELLTSLVQNQLKLHPNVKTVHIGCRKPMMLGWSLISKQWMHRNEKNLQQLYLDYVLRIVKSVKSKLKGLGLLVLIFFNSVSLNQPN